MIWGDLYPTDFDGDELSVLLKKVNLEIVGKITI
jgi:hypothetical protein